MTKLMLHKPLFIIYVVKGLLKSYTVYYKNEAPQLQKWVLAHAYQSFIKTLGFKFQINEVMKHIQTRNK